MFEQSTEINELITALVVAKMQMESPTKSAKSHLAKYANIIDYIEVIEPELLKNGLVFIQHITDNDKGLRLLSLLCHKSGQWMRSSFPIEPEDEASSKLNSLQEQGKAITYLKRYAASAIFFRAGVDDDNDADTFKGRSQAPLQPQKGFVKWIEKDQVVGIRALLAQKGDPEREQKICDHYRIDSLYKLPEQKYEELITLLKVK